MPDAGAQIFVDHTHCGRHVTGLERITQELFSREALAPLPVTIVTAPSREAMLLRQVFGLPWTAARNPKAIVITPGFPPSPLLSLFGARVLPYIHDVFLLTRRQDLNYRAKLYMALPFRIAVRRLPRFLVNSQHTRDELRRFCRPDAEIILFRPAVRNVFGLSPAGRAERGASAPKLRLIALGTVEPRKNLLAAAAILTALRARHFSDATLDIVGRVGWGPDAAALQAMEGVTLHGYQSQDATRRLLEDADLYITTAHDEGLGLPLLEAQYAGLPVIAPDKAVFREVLGRAGLLLGEAGPQAQAARIAACVEGPGWRALQAAAAADNLTRWNEAAELDKVQVLALIARLSGVWNP